MIWNRFDGRRKSLSIKHIFELKLDEIDRVFRLHTYFLDLLNQKKLTLYFYTYKYA